MRVFRCVNEAGPHDGLDAVTEVTLREEAADFTGVVGLADDLAIVPTSLTPDLELDSVSRGSPLFLPPKSAMVNLPCS